MEKNIMILVVMATICSNVFAGTVKKSSDEYNSQIYWKAKATFEEADFKQSLLLFTYLLDQDPENSELNAYVGLCYKRLSKEKVASFYFNKVSEDKSMFLKIAIEDLRSSHLSSL